MTTLRTALTATMLVLATGGSAHAAAPWSPPIDLGPPANGADAVGLAFSPRGAGLLSWKLGQSSFVAALRGDGTLGRRSRLPADLAAGPVLPAGTPPAIRPRSAGTIVVMRRLLPSRRTAATSPPAHDRTRLSWALVGADGTVGRVRTLTTARCLICQVTLAVNWLGDAIAVWREPGGTRASYRRRGGRFGTPGTVFRGQNGQYPDLTVAMDGDGRALVVDAGEVVRARMRGRDGRLRRVMRVGRGNGSVRASAAFSNGGQAIVAWGSQDGGEEANEPWVVCAARLRRGAGRFSVTQTLDAGSARNRPEGRIALAFTPGGRATAAWSSVGPRGTFPVMAAAARNGGRFGQPQQLAPSGAVGAVAVRADGAAVVVWSRLVGSQQPVQVFASVRGAGGTTFGAPEEVAAPDVAFFPPRVAFDPVSGLPTAAWGARPNPPSPAGVVDDAIVHVTTRAAPAS